MNQNPSNPKYMQFLNKDPEEVWEMIEDFEFPSSLSSNLRNKYMIDVNTSYLWIHEYRKFLVLQCLYGFEMVPSYWVEAVWRLHMANSFEYREFLKVIDSTKETKML